MIRKLQPGELMTAARIRSESWTEAHGFRFSQSFRDIHNPRQQLISFEQQLKDGAEFYILWDGGPRGIVSLMGDCIENLYVLPEQQNRGYGTALLDFAVEKCPGKARLWVLCESSGAVRLYSRKGFVPTGRKKEIREGIYEMEMLLEK